MSNLELIGFDLRLSPDEYVLDDWTADRRRTFLLVPGIPWPLSVDEMVWPSLFQYPSVTGQPVSLHPGRVLVTLTGPHQESFCLWASLSKMKEAVERTDASALTKAVPIAVQVIADVPPRGNLLLDEALGEVLSPPTLPQGSALLGYDVADDGMISGLSNCGYDESVIDTLSSTWRPHLNEFGLLTSIDRAMEFRALTDKRVPEHAPFYVWSLHRLSLP